MKINVFLDSNILYPVGKFKIYGDFIVIKKTKITNIFIPTLKFIDPCIKSKLKYFIEKFDPFAPKTENFGELFEVSHMKYKIKDLLAQNLNIPL